MKNRPRKSILMVQCTSDVVVRPYEYDPIGRLGVPCKRMTSFLPISIATLAALTPDGYDVDLWDENLKGHIDEETAFERAYDLVAISVMFSTVRDRAIALARLFRERHVLVVAGGPGLSTQPEYFRDDFDVVFVNEVEHTWPQFLGEWEAGSFKREYRQIERPDISDHPLPRWDLLGSDVRDGYLFAAVQTTRGCPFDCEFCDVIYLFGRRQRHKSIERVLEEVRSLEKLGARNVFITDDEFVGDPDYCMELLTRLIPLNNSFRYPLTFSTQETINLSKNARLLELHADANFHSTLIGIESINVESLRETHKYQNVRADLVTELNRINAHGIGIMGSMIVGFDHDELDVFDRLYDFIQSTYIVTPRVYTLQAVPGTKLWGRMKSEGRLIRPKHKGSRASQGATSPLVHSNITPKNMSYVELLEGQHRLLRRVYEWDAIAARLKGWVANVARVPQVRQPEINRDTLDTYIAQIGAIFGAGTHAVEFAEDVLTCAIRVEPLLGARVARMILNNIQARLATVRSSEAFEADIEEARRSHHEIDDEPVTLPPAFGQTFERIYPHVYRRLHAGLLDKTKVPAASVEIFVDFLVRWGRESGGAVVSHHIPYLEEICDRVCARMNGALAAHPVTLHGFEHVSLEKMRRTRLADAVLKDIRDELARLSATTASSQ